MNRRGFFALLGAIAAAPKDLRLVPAPVEMVEVFEWHQIPPLTGLAAWLPDGDLPMSVAGRFEWLAYAFEEGIISKADFARLA